MSLGKNKSPSRKEALESSTMEDLAQTLVASVSELSIRNDQLAVAFSGGLDSTMLAYLAIRARRERDLPPPKLYVTGLDGSHDIKAAKFALQQIRENLGVKLDLVSLELSFEQAKSELQELIQLLGPDPMGLSFLLPLYVLAKRVEAAFIISGQGADELFGGYSRYRTMTEEERDKAMQDDLEDLIDGGLERDLKVANNHSKQLLTPYLDHQCIDKASSIRPFDRFHGFQDLHNSLGKGLLREMAKHLGLPSQLVELPKKAAQYGSGFQKVVDVHFEPLHTANLVLNYKTSEIARKVAQATGPDNLPYVSIHRQRSRLRIAAASRTIGGLEQTLDDLLACTDTAGKIATQVI